MTRYLAYALALIFSTSAFSQEPLSAGQKIIRDFNGDNKPDTAIISIRKSSTPNKYSVSFSDKTIPPMVLGCCEVILVNEGDLNSDKKTAYRFFRHQKMAAFTPGQPIA